jgi:hypothetical protein
MRRLLLIVLVFLVAATAIALEVQEGRIKLVLDEESSRFLVYLRDATGDEWVPLLFAEDPRSSGLDVREGNRVYRMGDGGEFRQVAEVTDQGVFYVWTSPTLRVAERFRFIRSVGSNIVDGVQLDVSVTNLGEQTVPAAVRLLLDTYLGERGNAHFITPLRDQITREVAITPGGAQPYIRSGDPASSSGLQVMISGNGVTMPQQVVVANWKRLADSEWDYEVNEQRNFNRLPYSINDSALLITYPAVTLEQNQRYTITTRFGDYADNGYLDPEASVTITAEERGALLSRLTALLDQIDMLLADPDVDAEQVARLRAELEELSRQVPGQ